MIGARGQKQITSRRDNHRQEQGNQRKTLCMTADLCRVLVVSGEIKKFSSDHFYFLRNMRDKDLN